ncbi:hypothetical protein [Rickettsia endosymbiont of Urophora cardui]
MAERLAKVVLLQDSNKDNKKSYFGFLKRQFRIREVVLELKHQVLYEI